MDQEKEYYAFISYSHKDEEWAKWLQHEFEHYHLPTTLNGLTGIPERFRPIFRDIDELSGGELKPQISNALRSSAYLVVICSPNSAKSPYVNEEILEFKEIGEQTGINNISNIFPFIIEGVPHCEDSVFECFPAALKELPSELIAGDVTKHGREHAFVKILSGTLHHSNVRFSMLWNQFERDRIEQERQEREKRDRLLLLESRYLSEKALDVAAVDSRLARMLILRALPKDINDPDDRPYCPEAESALRKIVNYKSAILTGNCFSVNNAGNQCAIASPNGSIRFWNITTGLPVGEILTGHTDGVSNVIFSHNGELIAFSSTDGIIYLTRVDTGKQAVLPMRAKKEHVKRLSFTHDDRLLLALTEDNLQIWDVDNGCLSCRIRLSQSNDMAIDNDDRWIALATLNFAVEVYDLKELKKVKEIQHAHSESLTSVDFSPDGSKIVTSSFDGRIRVWDWAKGEMLLSRDVGKVTGAYAPVILSSRYSKDGKLIITASQDHMIRIWNADTGELEMKPLSGHAGSVTSAHFSPDGSFIVSSSLDGEVRIWDLNPKVPYRIVGRARAIPFNTKTVKKWEETDLLINGHSANPHTAAISPDGKLLATASAKEIKVWDVDSNMQMGMDFTFFDDFLEIMFLESGRGIIAETEKDYDVLFDWAPLQELINNTQEQVRDRQFTDDEKKKYYLD